MQKNRLFKFSVTAKEFLAAYTRPDYLLVQKLISNFVVVALVGHPIFYVILSQIAGYWESFPMRLANALLFSSLLLLPRQGMWSIYQRVHFEMVWLLALPVFFNVMMLINEVNTYWACSLIVSAVLYGLFANGLWGLALYPIGAALTLFIFHVNTALSPDTILAALLINLAAYFISFLMSVSQALTKHAYLELFEANLTKDRFFSIIAHDLRGPVGTIASFIGLLKTGSYQIEEDILQGLDGATDTVRVLLEDLLIWALNQQGKLTVQSSDFALRTPAESAVQLLSSMAMQKEIELINQVAPEAVVHADPRMVATIIRNLLNNALKFTDTGGKITLSSRQEGDMQVFEVADTGIGITLEKQRCLFAPEKSMHSLRGNEGRTGLGLVLVKDFMKLNGGKVGVVSQPEVGSNFWFSLPVAQKI